jgi:dTDP-4-dehydrorhamnose reductase
MRPDRVRVVVLGGSGMLGHRMFLHLREFTPEVVCTVRQRPAGVALFDRADVVTGVDLMDLPRLEERLERWQPELVINCAGVVKQREAAHDAIACLTINSLLPHRVARALAAWGGRLIHFSTDCVFSGRKGAYRESDPADADDLYGRSKLLGEVSTPNALTLRTSMIGRELRGAQGMLEWLISSGGGRVRGFRRAIYSGLTTPALARLTAELWWNGPPLNGLYHVAAPPISKYDLLLLLRDAFHLRLDIEPEVETVCDRSLDDSAFRAATALPMPAWPELVRELARDDTTYREWRAASCTTA